ncbi:hypothetical protein HK096_000959, partial [Nowakowskiella sp. JEL0078]
MVLVKGGHKNISFSRNGRIWTGATDFAFANGNKDLIASCGVDGKVNIYDAKNGCKIAKQYSMPSPLTSISINDENVIAVGTVKGDIALFDLRFSKSITNGILGCIETWNVNSKVPGSEEPVEKLMYPPAAWVIELVKRETLHSKTTKPLAPTPITSLFSSANIGGLATELKDKGRIASDVKIAEKIQEVAEIFNLEKVADCIVDEKDKKKKAEPENVEMKLAEKNIESKIILDSKDAKEKQPVLDRAKIRKEIEKTEIKKLDFSSAFSELQKPITSPLLSSPVNQIIPQSAINQKSLNFPVNTKQTFLQSVSPNHISEAQHSKNTKNEIFFESQKVLDNSEMDLTQTSTSIIKRTSNPKSQSPPDLKQKVHKISDRRSSLKQSTQPATALRQGRPEIRAPRKSISADNLATHSRERSTSRSRLRNSTAIESLVRGVEAARREVQDERKSVGSTNVQRELKSERKKSTEKTQREILEESDVPVTVTPAIHRISMNGLELQNSPVVVESLLDPPQQIGIGFQGNQEEILPVNEKIVTGNKELQFSGEEEVPYGVLTGLVQDCLEDFRVQVRTDVLNIHVELVRRFQMQQEEIQSLLEKLSPMKDLLFRIESLERENERL